MWTGGKETWTVKGENLTYPQSPRECWESLFNEVVTVNSQK